MRRIHTRAAVYLVLFLFAGLTLACGVGPPDVGDGNAPATPPVVTETRLGGVARLTMPPPGTSDQNLIFNSDSFIYFPLILKSQMSPVVVLRR